MKKLLGILGLSLAVSTSANATLATGDIAFIGFNADGDDGFSIVALADIMAGESIYFRDDEWDGGAFGTGEGEFIWNTPSLAAGSVVTFVTDAGGTPTTSAGTISADPAFSPGDMGISASGETIFAYLGASNSPATFLAAIGSDNSDPIQDTTAGTGLTTGTTAVALGGDIDVAEYTGPRSGLTSFADYLALIGDTNNWNIVVGGSGDQSGEVLPFNTTSFTVVPIPAAVWLFGSAFGALLLRRRSV